MVKIKYSLSNNKRFSFDVSEIFLRVVCIINFITCDLSVGIGIRDALPVVNERCINIM